MEMITSLQNKFIKLAASLKQKKYRDELGLFLVEGVRLVEEAAASNWLVETCIYTGQTMEQERFRNIINDLAAKGCHMLLVSDSVYGKITDTKEPQGIMVIVRKDSYSLQDMLAAGNKECFIILDGVQDPGNVGTMIRTAAAAGCTGVILTKGCADVFATKAVRSSMGSIFHVPIIEGLGNDDIISSLDEHGITILATSLESSKVYFDINFDQSIAIVFGNEGNGVSHELLEKAKERLYIPLYNQVESLNVAASAAIILYEIVRQRR